MHRSFASVLALLSFSFFGATALADPVDSGGSALARDHLQLEASFWGIDLVRNGEDVGPGFLNLALADAVRGSADAEDAADRAVAWQVTGLSLVVASIGLLVADALVYRNEHEGREGAWLPIGYDESRSTGSMALSVAWLGTAALGGLARWLAFDAVLDSVNTYNRDLLDGRIATRTAQR